MSAKTEDTQSTWTRDFISSIVVFLVALPLCIGIAVAVGVNPARAIITGVIGGIVVGFLAGSPLQVSGPAAGLFVIVADLITRYRTEYLTSVGESVPAAEAEAAATIYAMSALGTAGILAGILQFIAGKLRMGQWFRAVSPAVIEGMLAGIGVLIFVSQFHVMLDHDPHYEGDKTHGGLSYIAAMPEAIYKCIVPSGGTTHHLAAMLGLMTIAIMVIWPMVVRGKLKMVPGPLVGVLAATITATFLNLPLIKLSVPENLLAEVTTPSSLTLNFLVTPSIVLSGLVIALVASAETLLCATAVDQMSKGQRTDYDKELRAQGVGNLLCGLVGALPMTGVIVRSSANVQAGAKTRWSTIIHGGWLLIFVVAFPALLAYIPKAVMGAVLVYTGFKLVKVESIRRLWKMDKAEVVVFFVTMTTIVTTDLLIGVLTGLVLTAALLLHRFSTLTAELEFSDDKKTATMNLHGTATFLRLPVLAVELEKVPDDCDLHVDLSHLSYIDHACLELLMGWAKRHESGGGTLTIDWESLHAKFHSGKENGAVTETTGTNGTDNPKKESLASV